MILPSDSRLRLLAVTDDLRDGLDGLVTRCAAAVRGGVTMVLLRLEYADARLLAEAGRALVAGVPAPVLVSDRADVALAVGAAGVHLRATSIPAQALRPHVPTSFLIGTAASTEDDVPNARQGDFVTIGPVFGATPTAIGLPAFRTLVAAIGLPPIAIGGVDAATAASVMSAGASGVAVLRNVLGTTDPRAAAADLLAAMRV
jgi:thiamine-phosphate pyrophosphorylase